MKIINLLFFSLMCTVAWASNLELDALIKATDENSLAQKAANESFRASVLEKERSTRHWLPKIYLSGQSFFSNEPGSALFGKLAQREIKNSDFMAESLNHPESSLYNKAAMGLNLALYEGGEKIAVSKAMSFMSEAWETEKKAVKNEFYNEVVKNYLIARNLSLEKNDLIKNKGIIDSIIYRYHIGNKSNQLGYSGLLGLKSLRNKISALLDENEAKKSGEVRALSELSGEKVSLSFSDNSSLRSLLDEYLNFSVNNYVPSNNVQAYFSKAKSAREVINAEKSRNLPRIGLFGEGYAFNGKRSTATGYTAGLYLNWNLFSGNDYGATPEAIHKSKAAQYFAEASLQKEKIEYEGLKDAREAILRSLVLLGENENYLKEQTKISHELFKNGLINALMYVEVISRQVDLIKSKRIAESELIAIHALLAKHKNGTLKEHYSEFNQ